MKERGRRITERLIRIGKNSYFNVMIKETAAIQFPLRSICDAGVTVKKILLIRDKAGYHRYSEIRSYLEEVNKGLEEKDWKITCLLSESAAPEQNPVEDIWLKGKNFLRRHFYQNKTSAQVEKSFFNFLNLQFYDFKKSEWYL